MVRLVRGPRQDAAVCHPRRGDVHLLRCAQRPPRSHDEGRGLHIRSHVGLHGGCGSNNMLLPRTQIRYQGNEARGTATAVSASHPLPPLVVGPVQHVPELHQLPHQGRLPILQAGPHHDHRHHHEPQNLLQHRIHVRFFGLHRPHLLLRRRLEARADLQSRRSRHGITLCLRRCRPSQCSGAVVWDGRLARGGDLLHQHLYSHRHDCYDIGQW
mmetsp:Transcript_7037/g.16839  ORF Transcript_7037/g.16839 Transcript_7037/m.16839 type:complete len:213 (-) Transcript_7037:544-1182(-)